VRDEDAAGVKALVALACGVVLGLCAALVAWMVSRLASIP